MMNYRKPKEELTVISCRKCGRAWQVTESDAENFSNHRGICPECRRKSKEKVSLLKKNTNFDRIKNMTVDEMALELALVLGIPTACDLCEKQWGDSCAADTDDFDCDINYRKSLMKQWLESEVDNATD